MSENGRSERPQNRTDAKPCLSDVYKERTRAKRRQADVRLSGRSMVEMLGVLAIIGVLSVGAMSGYSKAMMKYKLNKQTEQISTLLNSALIYAGEFQIKSSASIVPYLIKLNSVPEEMIYGTTSNPILYDALHSRIGITWSKETTHSVYNMSISIGDSDNDLESCRNIINTVKENHADLYQVVMRLDKDDESSDSTNFISRTFGDNYCTGSNSSPCIHNMKLTQIDNFCRVCSQDDNQICHIQIFYGLERL